MSKYGRGDDGKSTYMGSSEKVWKNEIFFQAVGDLDELNSFIGFTRSLIDEEKFKEVDLILKTIQDHILKIGGEINTIGTKYYDKVPKLEEKDIQFLEEKVREIEEKLPSLTSFILPSGSKISTALHICRTVTRRAERSIIGFHREIKLPDRILTYMNRLSTLFFVLARYVNLLGGFKEEKWES